MKTKFLHIHQRLSGFSVCLSVYLDTLPCGSLPVHPCFCLFLSERICTASIFSLCFRGTFSNLSPSHPLPMLLWRTLKPSPGVTMPHCAAAYSRSNQGHSTGYINTTATLLRPSLRDETHMNFSMFRESRDAISQPAI